MNRPPRLLLLIPHVGLGGAQRVFRDHSVALAERYSVEEAIFNDDHFVVYESGNVLHNLEVTGGRGTLAKLLNFAKRIARLAKLKSVGQFDICISHLEGADYVNLMARTRARTILCVHGSKAHDPSMTGVSGFLRRRILIPRLYNRADRIVTVSRDIKPELIAMGVEAKRIHVINNYFDVAGIAASAGESLSDLEQALFAQRPVLLTSGRLAPQKNQAALIDIFADLRDRRPATLMILGDGELRDALIAQARNRSLTVQHAWSGEPFTIGADVYFLGMQPNPFKYLSRADLFLFPSEWEGFPLALCEGMICGVPALTTDCRTGPREILAPETTRAIPPIDREERGEFGLLMPILHQATTVDAAKAVWVETILRLLDSPSERVELTRLGKRRMEDFTRERIAPLWFALIDQLLDEVCSQKA